VAAHKGKIIRPTPVGGGIRSPQFMEQRPPVKGAYFDLLSPRDSRRTIVIHAKSSIRITAQRGFRSDQQCIVLNRLHQNIDIWQAIAQAFRQSSASAVRVTHPRQHTLDTALRISGSRARIADSAQHVQQTIDRVADAGLTVFNVIINEHHEIQSHEVAF